MFGVVHTCSRSLDCSGTGALTSLFALFIIIKMTPTKISYTLHSGRYIRLFIIDLK